MGAPQTKQARYFGLTVGAVATAFGIWPLLIRSEPPRLWAVATGVSLVLLAIVVPRSLTRLSRYWFALSEILGRINSRIILAIIFYTVLTPIGLIRRLTSADPLGRRFDRKADTYRVRRRRRPPSHMSHQF